MRSFNLVVVLLVYFIICGATAAGADEINMTLVSTFETDGQASDIELKDKYAYIADGENGLVVIDVSNPSSPTFAGKCDVNGSADDIAIEKDHAYVTGEDNGLKIIDISNPSSPILISNYDTDGIEKGIAVSEGYAYLANGINGLLIVDVGNSSSPSLAGYFNESDFCACDVVVEDSYAYVASKSGLFIIDVSDPESPALAGTNNPGFYVMDFEYEGITVSGNRTYSIDSYNRLFIDDISDPSTPNTYKNSTTCSPAASTPGNVGIVVLGDYAYAGSEHFGIVNISDPSAPFIAGYFDTERAACGVAVSDSYAYVIDNNGLVILRMEKIGTTPDGFLNVDILNPDGFLVGQNGSILIQVKITDSTGNPVEDSEEVSVQMTFNNSESPLYLFDDGAHNDEEAGDGIYANEWTHENLSYSDEIGYTLTVSAPNPTVNETINEISGLIVFNNGINSTTTGVASSPAIDPENDEDGRNDVSVSSSNGGSPTSGEENGEVVYRDTALEIESTNDDVSSEAENIVSESGVGSFESDKEQDSPGTNEFYSKKWTFLFVIGSILVLFVGYLIAGKRK